MPYIALDRFVQEVLFFLFLFVLGNIWGSFLGVLADRIPRNESIIYPPSHCNDCKTKLEIRDLLPLYSWISGKGKCRFCFSPIDKQALHAELMTGLFFLLLGMLYLEGNSILSLFLYGSFAIPLSIIDIRYFRLPHVLTIAALTSGMILSILSPERSFLISLEGAITALVFLGPIAYFKPNALGMGDAIFFGAIGSFTSPEGILIALIVASGSALLASFSWILWEAIHRRKTSVRTLKIPFGPFLSLGGGAAILLSLPHFQSLNHLFF